MTPRVTALHRLKALQVHWKKLLWIIIPLAVGLFYWAQSQQASPVEAIRLERKDTVATVTLTGVVRANRHTQLNAPFEASIVKILVDEGQSIGQGQPLILLEHSVQEAAVEGAEASYQQSLALLQETRRGARQEEQRRLKARKEELGAVIQEEKARFRAAQPAYDTAYRQVERYKALYQQGAVSQQELDQKMNEEAQALATLKASQNEVVAAQARLAQATQELAASQKGRPEDIQQQQAASQASQASLAQASMQLAQRTLKAPYDAVVLKRLKSPGDITLTGNPVLEIANLQDIEIVADLQEANLAQVAPHHKVMAIFDALPDQLVEGVVEQVGHSVNADQGTIDVIVKFKPEVLKTLPISLFPGMSVDVTIFSEQLKDALVIPVTATESHSGENWVHWFNGTTFEAKPVKLRRISLETYEVLQGLKSGDRIAKTVKPENLSQQKKRPVEPPAASNSQKAMPSQ